MKKFVFVVILFSFLFLNSVFLNHAFAQSKNNKLDRQGLEFQQFDCSKSGECSSKKNQQDSLYADNLIPGFPVIQKWNLRNKSNNPCRIYLFFRGYSEQMTLAEMIKISAFETTNTNKQPILDGIKFSDLLQKESLHLVEIPAKSESNINWEILLDESVDNSFQGTQKEFNTVLYSYCVKNKKGEVAGVSTQNQVDAEEIAYIVLASVSGLSLLVLKFKKFK